MRHIGEIALIEEFLAPLATLPGSLGLKDDAAILADLPSTGLVITTDALVAGVHFFEEDSPGDAAYKALAANISDLAAKAAKPIAYTLTLALREAPLEDWAKEFACGLARAQADFGLGLIGGDTVMSRGAWWMSITAFGAAPARGILPRGGARSGDLLYLSGSLGDAALGLRLRLGTGAPPPPLTKRERDHLLHRYLYPEPRLALAPALEACASAAMDLSDGLALDLSRLCRASGVSAQVRADSLPLSEAARAFVAFSPDVMQTILSGGDDYEILAAVPPGHAAGFEALSREAGVAVTRIGLVTESHGAPEFIGGDGLPVELSSTGFEHFKS